jgi:hypothetical protein
MNKRNDDQRTPEETAAIRDAALKRALGMKPKPHKRGVDKNVAPKRPKAKIGQYPKQ